MVLDISLIILCLVLFMLISLTRDVVVSCLYFLVFQMFFSALYFRYGGHNLGIILFFLYLGLSLIFLIYGFIFFKNINGEHLVSLKKNKHKMIGIILACIMFGILFLFIEGTGKNLNGDLISPVQKNLFMTGEGILYEFMLLFFFAFTVIGLITFQHKIKKQ